MNAPAVCETCDGRLDQVGIIWDMGYRVAAEHGCNGDPAVCARACPVPTPDTEMTSTPRPNLAHTRAWPNATA